MNDATEAPPPKGGLKPPVHLSIIIPCYNEEETISRTVAAISDYLNKFYPEQVTELILINDGSIDRTGEILAHEALSRGPRIRPHHFAYNRGRGAAIKTGIRMSAGELVICLDADLSYDVDHIGEILQEFTKDPRTGRGNQSIHERRHSQERAVEQTPLVPLRELDSCRILCW
ncbi:MAG: glycosyltransferase family 2 protein [Planctomycetota bacterium]|nr:glycosyltransferase family 2 protein [Planctomycetota bacterium]